MIKLAAAAAFGLVLLSGVAGAQTTTITVGDLPCMPLEGNVALTAQLKPDVAGASVRLYFRRLSLEVEDFYYVEMRPSADGGYWGVFPDPEDHPADRENLKNEQENAWAKWWKAKEASDHRNPNGDLDDDVIRERASLGKLEKRSWMAAREDRAFQEWLQKLENEPAEYFVAAYDARGRQLARTEMRVVEVRKKNCDVRLTPQQEGYAENLVVGESREWQTGKAPFHWECDGVTTRIDTAGVLRADDACRVCAIAWWRNPAVIVPAAMGTLTLVTISTPNDPVEISPSRPNP